MTTTTPTATELSLPEALETLMAAPTPSGHVLSAYIDTSPDRTIGNAYLLAYRDAIRGLRSIVDVDDRALFESAAAQAEAYLTTAPSGHGVAVFASGDARYLFAVELADAPAECVDWDTSAHIAQLQAIVDDHERIAIVMFDSERARIYSICMGAIESEQVLRDDVPSKQATGGWYSLAQTNMARHREDHLRRHAERTVRELMQLLRARSFDRLLVAGPSEAVAVLRRELTRPLRARVAGELELEMFATDAEVLTAGRLAAEALERDAEKHVVDELLTDGGHAVLDLAGTLAALAEGRVHVLVLADTFHTPGARCTDCQRLTIYVHRCPACGAPTQPLTDLREPVVAQARSTRAHIEFVSGPAGRRLEDHGGIGAWTRF